MQIYTTYRHFLKYENNKTHYLLFSKAQQIYCSMLLDITSSDADCTPSHDVERQQRTVNCGWRYNLELPPCQCTANITYNLAAVVDIWLINHHLQIDIGR